jgi:hypothetical protein
MELNLDENDAAVLRRDGAKKRLRFDEGEPDDRRKRSREHKAKPIFTEYNWNEDGSNKGECSMYSLNSTLVNCLDREPVKTWQDSGIPQYVESVKMKRSGPKVIKETLWFPSDRRHGSMNQANASWAPLFKHLDPSGRTSTMDAEKFYNWALLGKVAKDFKYAVAQLPGYKGVAHAVSIIRSDTDQLLLVDSNYRKPKTLSSEALQNRQRWFMFPRAYVVIKHTD